jgi:hypothetical protein
VPDHEHELLQSTRDAEIFEQAKDDRRHLVFREARVSPERGLHVVAAIEGEERSRRRGRDEAAAPLAKEAREAWKEHAQDERDRRQRAEPHREQRASQHRQAARRHHAAQQADHPARARAQERELAHRVGQLLHLVLGPDGHGAERPRVRVLRAAVVHRDAEEARRPERLARRLHLLEVAADRLHPLVEAEDGLESRSRRRLRRVEREGVEQRAAQV